MKIIVHIKDPDGFYESIRDAVREEIATLTLSKQLKDMVEEERIKEVNEMLKQWVTYGECTEIEFDTDAKTATVRKPQ